MSVSYNFEINVVIFTRLINQINYTFIFWKKNCCNFCFQVNIVILDFIKENSLLFFIIYKCLKFININSNLLAFIKLSETYSIKEQDPVILFT